MTDRRRVSLFALLALLGALALLAAGCGGGSDESSGSTETTVETTVDTETTEETDTSSETTEETDTTSANPFASEDCLQLANIGAKFSEAMSGQDATANLDTTSAFFDELVSQAPDEIKDDLATLASAWKEIASALKDVDLSSGQTPSPETIAKLQELGNKFNTPELQKASQHLQQWATDNCGASTG
jgi:hypothetical protein